MGRGLLSIVVCTIAVFGSAEVSDAGLVTTTNYRSISSSSPFPASTGTHSHSSLGQPAEVGSYFSSEECRAVAEFNLAGETTASAVIASFSVSAIGGTLGQTGPGSFTIFVEAYSGNNSISNSDFSGAVLGTTLGTFSTSGITAGQVFSFNATSAFNSALSGSGSLGIRLGLSSNPGNHVANRFDSFQINTTPIPEPTTWALFALGAGLLGVTVRRRRSRA